MIYTERVINVKNGTATIDQPIVLFRGDRNIEIVFEIVNSKFKFSEKGNYILDIGAKYGQLAVDMPDGTDLFTEIAECMDGKVIFKITGDMINEIAENGFYSFHVRLFNEDKTSRVTIPPIMEGIEVREPIVIEGDGIFPIVDMGTSDVAVIDSDKETFIDENGKLSIEWKNGDIISSTKLNQMVEYINDMEDKVISEDNLANYATLEHVNEEFDIINNELNILDGAMANTQQMAMNAEEKATEARDIINSRYDQLDERLQNQQDTLEQFEATVANAEANAAAALAGFRTLESQIDKNATDIYDIYDKLDLNYVHVDTMNYQHGLLQTDINQNKASIDGLDERLQILEDVDLSGYATIEYVNSTRDNINETIGGLQNDLGQDIRDAIDMYDTNIKEHIDGEIQGVYEALDGIPEEFASIEYVNDMIIPLESTVNDHEVRITALEQADGGNVDLSGYATTEYVDGQISDIQTALEMLPDDPFNPEQGDCIIRAYALQTFPTKGALENVETELQQAIDEHTTRIQALEEADGGDVDLSGYATTEYVDGQIGTLNDRVDHIDSEIADAGVDMLREDLEAVRAIAEEGMSEEKREEFKTEIMDSVETDFIHPQNEAIQAHDERIQALEEAGGGNVDLTGYATTEYVDGQISDIQEAYVTKEYLETNYHNKMHIASNYTTSTRVENMINDAIGDINSILDAINGEVI